MGGHIQDSGRTDWNTPKHIIETCREFFNTVGFLGIALDPCSNDTSLVNAITSYKLPLNDGLIDSWDFPTIFVNPPYGRSLVHPVTKRILSPSIVDMDEFLDLPVDIGRLYDWYKNKYRLNTAAAKKAGNSSTTISNWVKRANEANINHDSEVIMIIPAAVDTRHWQKIIFPNAAAINFLKGRVHFDGLGPAPMACALVYFGSYAETFCVKTKELGSTINLRNE